MSSEFVESLPTADEVRASENPKPSRGVRVRLSRHSHMTMLEGVLLPGHDVRPSAIDEMLREIRNNASRISLNVSAEWEDVPAVPVVPEVPAASGKVDSVFINGHLFKGPFEFGEDGVLRIEDKQRVVRGTFKVPKTPAAKKPAAKGKSEKPTKPAKKPAAKPAKKSTKRR